MTSSTGIDDLAADSGPLVNVVAKVSDGAYWAVDLTFALGVLSLRCDIDTDEIIASTDAELLVGSDVVDVHVPGLLGLQIEYLWMLTNHRGYSDGLQLRLSDSSGAEETRQFEVMASKLKISRVTLLDEDGVVAF